MGGAVQEYFTDKVAFPSSAKMDAIRNHLEMRLDKYTRLVVVKSN